jgi:hypothetical protein
MDCNYQVPSTLSKAILNGDFIAFVGAGFSAAGGLPSWSVLLEGILAEVSDADLSVEYIRERIKCGTAHALDEAAQALEDAIGRDRTRSV